MRIGRYRLDEKNIQQLETVKVSYATRRFTRHAFLFRLEV